MESIVVFRTKVIIIIIIIIIIFIIINIIFIIIDKLSCAFCKTIQQTSNQTENVFKLESINVSVKLTNHFSFCLGL